MLPGALRRAVEDTRTTFELDIGLVDWRFGEEEAQRITQPVLVVLGGDSNALWSRFGEGHRLLVEWLPDAEEAVIHGVTHMMHVESPRAVAGVLAAFLSRHPIPRPATADSEPVGLRPGEPA